MKDLLRTADLAPDDVIDLLNAAAAAKRRPSEHRDELAGESVVLYFAKPSTRTRLSFETAVARLGGVPVAVGGDQLQLGRGETIEDTARVVSRYAAAFVIRTFDHRDVERFASAATIPVVNALTDLHHPCQSLADLMTLRERFGRLEGLRIAYLGDGNNVCHSLMEACALAGCRIKVAAPPQLAPRPDIVTTARAIAAETGARVEVTTDPVAAVEGADAVYTDVWLSMGTSESERAARAAALTGYQVTETLFAHAAPNAVFLHCLPAHRGDEVTAEVIDGPRSLVWEQAENRLHTSVALLDALVHRSLKGRRAPLRLGA